MLNTPHIAELIKSGNIAEMKEVMEKSASIGMQTFDMALYKLYQSGKISREEALKYADSENNLSLKIGFGGEGAAGPTEEALKYADSENDLSLKIGFGEEDTTDASTALG